MSFTEDGAPPPEEAQTQLEKRAAELALLALVVAQDGNDDETDRRVLERTARTVARLAVFAAIAAATRSRSAKGSVNDAFLRRESPARDQINKWIEETTQRLVTDSRALANHAAQRMEPGPGEPSPTSAQEDTARREWARSAGTTLSTRLSSEAVLKLAGPLETQLGSKLRKVWISRGDNRVRDLHRKLHAQTAELDKPFWRELGTGKTLSFPGDPRAPLDQTINCRCHMFLVKAEEAPKAEEVLHIPASDFALAASAAVDPGLRRDFEVAYAWASKGEGRRVS